MPKRNSSWKLRLKLESLEFLVYYNLGLLFFERATGSRRSIISRQRLMAR